MVAATRPGSPRSPNLLPLAIRGSHIRARTWYPWTTEPGDGSRSGHRGLRKATVGEALRASWAIPGWFPPVTIDGVRYIDGGAASTASVDLLLPLELDELVVLAPMASRTLKPARGAARIERGALRNSMSKGLDREIELVRAAGTRVLRIDATDDDLAVMGANFMDGPTAARHLRIIPTYNTCERETRTRCAPVPLHPVPPVKAQTQ